MEAIKKPSMISWLHRGRNNILEWIWEPLWGQDHQTMMWSLQKTQWNWGTGGTPTIIPVLPLSRTEIYLTEMYSHQWSSNKMTRLTKVLWKPLKCSLKLNKSKRENKMTRLGAPMNQNSIFPSSLKLSNQNMISKDSIQDNLSIS